MAKYARIEMSKKRFDRKEKSVAVNVDRWNGSEVVYVPKSKIIVESVGMVEGYEMPRVTFLAPTWIFTRKCLYATNADGFQEIVEIE